MNEVENLLKSAKVVTRKKAKQLLSEIESHNTITGRNYGEGKFNLVIPSIGMDLPISEVNSYQNNPYKIIKLKPFVYFGEKINL